MTWNNFKNSCFGKVRHSTKSQAGAARKSLCGRYERNGRKIPRLALYRCIHCGGWHMGGVMKDLTTKA